MTDRIKDLVIAKIAMQAADLYADALSNMQVGSIKSMWDKVCFLLVQLALGWAGLTWAKISLHAVQLFLITWPYL